MKRSIFLMTVISMVIALFISCDEHPVDPGHDNPFDIENPATASDIYELQIGIADGGIQLSWTELSAPGPDGYNVYRNENETVFEIYAELAATGNYTDESIINGNRYKYYVVAYDANGEANASNLAEVKLDTDPILVIESETGKKIILCGLQ